MDDPNVAATLLRHGNFDFVTNSVVWDPSITDHDLPVSLYLSKMPDWWCLETPWPPIGPDVAGYYNDIPAKRRFEGLPCTHPTDLILRGVPADKTIYLNWEVSVSVPVTSTWDIGYGGPPGDQASPITGLPESTRAFTLTGLTNYVPYDITLQAILDNTSILTGTITVMPSDIFLYLPVVFKIP